MQYKEQIKENELITKIRIIRYVLKEHMPIVQVAKSFSCHRNTVGNIVRAFEMGISGGDKELLLKSGSSYSQEELSSRYEQILNHKRIPKTHKKSASKPDETEIVSLFKDKGIKVGINQMKLTLDRRFGENQGLAHLTIGQLKGIYKRNKLKTAIVRSSNGERKHLYDYRAIACFQFRHFDVNYLLYKNVLPEDS